MIFFPITIFPNLFSRIILFPNYFFHELPTARDNRFIEKSRVKVCKLYTMLQNVKIKFSLSCYLRWHSFRKSLFTDFCKLVRNEAPKELDDVVNYFKEYYIVGRPGRAGRGRGRVKAVLPRYPVIVLKYSRSLWVST